MIEKYDLFHSFLGEMKPQFLNDVISGGHLPLIELRSAVLEIGEIQSFGNGFFDMVIKRGSKRKMNSYFPLGKSVEQCIGMIEEGFENIEKIKNVIIPGRLDQLTYDIKNYQNQTFRIHIEKQVATFYPFFDKGI